MKFQTFLTRASSCRPLPSMHNSTPSSMHIPSRKIILLEDLPNILHAGTADAFHAALQDYITSPSDVPIVLVISDAGTRGEDPEDNAVGGRAWGQWRKETIDVRSVIPNTILNSPYFREIQYALLITIFQISCSYYSQVQPHRFDNHVESTDHSFYQAFFDFQVHQIS